jgi:hypothetical protein
VLIGLAAIVFSALYFASDLMEFAHGGFSTPQLTLTLVAEAAIPFIVIGLYVVQRPAIAQLGLVGAVLYAYSFIFFTGTVVFALVNGTRDWNALTDQLGGWVSIHGALMVLAGMAFGVAIIRAGVLPRWTGAILIAGIVLVAVTPLLLGPLVLSRYDLWPAALVVAAVAAFGADRHRLAWLALACAVAAKLSAHSNAAAVPLLELLMTFPPR